jgi:hypothetical protein
MCADTLGNVRLWGGTTGRDGRLGVSNKKGHRAG